MELVLLADFPTAMPTIARWYFDEWLHQVPGETPDSIAASLRDYVNRDCVPLMVVAVDGGDVAGTVQLKFREMDIYPEKDHWLGGMYVADAYRRSGLASRLAGEIIGRARSLGVETLHLQTERQDGGLYARLGWQPVESVQYKGRRVLVMERPVQTV